MRNIKVRWTRDFLQVHILIAREREPRGEVCRVKPGVAENTYMPSLNKQASLAQECDLQKEFLSFTQVNQKLLAFVETCKGQARPAFWPQWRCGISIIGKA